MNFCPHCGGKLSGERYCPVCGVDLFIYFAREGGEPERQELSEKEKREILLSNFEISGHEVARYLGKGGKVVIPDGITAVKEGAFYRCGAISQVLFPESVKRIGQKAFFGCTSLSSISLPEDLEFIGANAFSGCPLEGDLVFPPTLREIGGGAFEKCNELKTVKICAATAKIGDGAFSGCKKLTGITVERANKKYESADGVLFDKGCSTLISYPCGKSGTAYSVPRSVKSICGSAFYSNEYLESIAIPSSVIDIMPDAFLRCSSLEKIKVAFGSRHYASDKGILYTKDMSTLVSYPCAKKDASFILPKQTKYIADNAVIAADNIIEAIIPAGIERIGLNPFYCCGKLERINVEEANAFFGSEEGVLFNKGKTKLLKYPSARNKTYYEIPPSVTALGTRCFAKSIKLASIIVPESVKEIGDKAFDECDALAYAYVPEKHISFYREIFPQSCVVTKK